MVVLDCGQNVKAWRIFRTNKRKIMAAAVHAHPDTSSSGRVSGVDRQYRPGHVATAISKQIFHHARDIVRLGQPAQRAAAGDALALIFGEALRQIVSTKPGAIAFTVIPSLPTSRASERVKPVAAALVAP